MRIITKDLYEAAYLLTKGANLIRAFGGRKTVLLLFEGDESLGLLKNQYRRGFAEVNIKALRKEMKQVKDLVFNFMRQTQGQKTMCVNL